MCSFQNIQLKNIPVGYKEVENYRPKLYTMKAPLVFPPHTGVNREPDCSALECKCFLLFLVLLT